MKNISIKDVIKIICGWKNLFLIALLCLQTTLVFSANDQVREKKVTIKENGNYVHEIHVAEGGIIFIRPRHYNHDFPVYNYLYEGEEIIDYKCSANRLYINGKLRGITINNPDDLTLIAADVNHINLRIRMNSHIANSLSKIKKNIFLTIDEDVFNGEDLLLIKNLKNFTHLSLYDINTDDSFANIKYLRNLLYLSLENANLKNKDLEHVKDLTGLKLLSLKEVYDINSDGIKHLKDLINLEYLDVSNTDLTNEGLQYFASMKKLKYLDLRDTHVSGIGLKHIKDLKELRYLDLSETRVSNAGLEYVSNLTDLETLVLILCKNFNDNGIKHLARLKKLKYLYLDYNDVTDNGMTFLKELKNLEALRISRLEVTAESLKHIKDTEKLRVLNIEDIKIKPKDLDYLKSMKNLEKLYLEYTGIDDRGIEIIAQWFKNLTVLDLSHTNITDKSLEIISRLQELREIYISRTNVTNEGIKYLAHLKKLNMLLATDTKADGFQHLLFVSEHAYKYYHTQKRLTYENAVCIKDGVEVRSGMGLLYPVIDTLKNGEQVVIIEAGEFKNQLNYELETDYYDEVNDIYLKQGSYMILVEDNDDGYIFAVENKNEKYIVSIEKEYLEAEYSYRISNDLYFYKIKTKNGTVGYINYGCIKKREAEPTGDTLVEYRLFHILVKDKELAEKIRIKIQEGESFEDLARAYSLCPSREDSGDLGWVDEELLIPEIKNKLMFIYESNRVSDIIKSKHGYHIMLVKGVMLKNEGYRFVYSY
ncbi:MAG: peptidylprolyl isomerase [Spirochaetales bacterium]|nr:peptidylprolyl isomerase [Spirochaetales bacterium]